MQSIKEKYNKTVAPELKKQFGYENVSAVPKIEKIVLNVGTGSTKDKAKKELIEKSITLITGQKPSQNLSKKSVAGFKLREGMDVGYSVTLRGQMMYDFLDKLVNVAIPRIRDFRGLNEKSIDGMGNFSMGFKEHIVFPEVSEHDVRTAFGLGVTIVTTSKKKEETEALLKLIGFPFKKDKK